jgi:hypothetical protein
VAAFRGNLGIVEISPSWSNFKSGGTAQLKHSPDISTFSEGYRRNRPALRLPKTYYGVLSSKNIHVIPTNRHVGQLTSRSRLYGRSRRRSSTNCSSDSIVSLFPAARDLTYVRNHPDARARGRIWDVDVVQRPPTSRHGWYGISVPSEVSRERRSPDVWRVRPSNGRRYSRRRRLNSSYHYAISNSCCVRVYSVRCCISSGNRCTDVGLNEARKSRLIVRP